MFNLHLEGALMNVTIISASNIINKGMENGASYRFSKIIQNELVNMHPGSNVIIIELKNLSIHPCTGCGKCYYSHRCVLDDDFNMIYGNIVNSDIVFIISPHYAPIPSKLAAMLEKMEQITFLHWGKDITYQSEVYGIKTGVISHGGGGTLALDSYKNMVNDTIANALETIQMKLIPFDDHWNTGISLPVEKVTFKDDNIFPFQEYDWDFITRKIKEYLDRIIKHIDRGNVN